MNSKAADTWVRRPAPRPDARGRVVCFPHAGGSASYFHPLCTAMPADVEAVAIQYPGRQDRRLEPLVEDLPTLVDAIVTALAGWSDVPLTFFGHSMGATVAFEVARRLERSGVVLTGLFVSGRRPPAHQRDERVHQSSDAELVRRVGELGGTPAELMRDPELAELILPAIRSDYRAIETYRYQPGPDVSCPLIAFTGAADPQVSEQEAAAWAEHTSGEFTLRVFPGGHFYLADELPAIKQALLEHIGAAGAAR